MNTKLHCENMTMSSMEATVVINRMTNEVVYVNKRAMDLFHLADMPLSTMRIRHFCSRADKFNEKAAINLFNTLKHDVPLIYDWPVRLGNIRWLSAFINLYFETSNEFVVVSFRDKTLEKESLIKLDSIVGFRDMLDELLSYNTMVAADKIPMLIDNSLSMVGNFFNCDRSYVFQYSEDLKHHSNINEWCAHGVEPYIDELQNIPTNKFSYLSKHLFNKEIVCLNDVNELPEEANNEREEFAKEGIQSILLIPFIEGEEVIGFVGLDHVRMSKVWTPAEVSNLKLLARAFANMLLRQRKEKRIQEQESMYKTWFMAANDSIAIFENAICVDANPKLLKDLNCSRDYLLGKSLVELSATVQPNEKSPTYIKVYHQKAMEGIPQFFEWVLRKQDGTDLDVEISLNRFSDKGNAHTIAILRDVSEHNQVVNNILNDDLKEVKNDVLNKNLKEKDLSLLELFDIEQLQKLQDAFSFATGISSLITDTQGNPITQMSFTNEICKMVRGTKKGNAMCQESGRELGEMAANQLKPISKSCKSCGFIDAAAPIIIDGHHLGNWAIGQVKPKDLPLDTVLNYTHEIGLSDELVKKEFLNLNEVRPDQFDRTLKLLNVLSQELSILGYNNLKLARSIQNHVTLEKKLRMAKQKAEESDRLKSAFLANLSHEIRTPMNGIVGFSELLQYEGLTPDDRKEYVRLIHQSSRQLLNIINDIIDISKIESGQIEVHSGFFDVNAVFANLESLFLPNAEAKNIKLQFVGDEEEMELFTDEVKLRQVMTNLISNAIKFTSVGHVEFGYRPVDGNKVCIFVRDSGVGIDADSVDFIFDRFWQAKDADVKKGGTGLGLAITKAYVELLGGHIKVESKVDEGTEFSFVLPRVLS